MIHSSEMCPSQRHKKITGLKLARLTQIIASRLFAAATILLILDLKALSASSDDHWYFTAEGVPAEVWAKKYRKLASDQILFALLWEPTLVALYHTAEHLEMSDPKTGQVNEEAKAWSEKRNVLGFFDGRPIQILPPHPMGFGVGMPPEYES
jgi:hypothetical protein